LLLLFAKSIQEKDVITFFLLGSGWQEEGGEGGEGGNQEREGWSRSSALQRIAGVWSYRDQHGHWKQNGELHRVLYIFVGSSSRRCMIPPPNLGPGRGGTLCCVEATTNNGTTANDGCKQQSSRKFKLSSDEESGSAQASMLKRLYV